VRTAASLEASARAARAAAARVVSGKPPSDAAQTAIHWAFQEIGIPYAWGGGDENGPTYGFAQGAGTKGFDCSGLTLFAYGKTGIHLDHYTGSQWGQGKRIGSRSDLQPGDLMFFAYDTSDPSTIHHVALYIGNGRMIEAPQTGDVVKVSDYGRDDFIGGTRPWQS
jgi:cell wall-associated NlpC family hydrolase